MNVLPNNPIALTIAGLDPSGCAGILADIKTFEANKVYGMAVCTANTEQNIGSFKKANWIEKSEIINQLRLLQLEVKFEFVKIGLIENFDLLDNIVDELKRQNPSVIIVWDPVCKASAQFVFHTEIEKQFLENICRKMYLITPNLEEQKILAPGMNTEEAGEYLSGFCNVLIKGGHGTTELSSDILFTKETKYYFESERLENFSKRGTGCVLSSAIVAHLAKGAGLAEACANAKNYINNYISSNNSLAGTHTYEN